MARLTPEDHELERKVKRAISRAWSAKTKATYRKKGHEKRRVEAGLGASFLDPGPGVPGAYTDPAGGGGATTPTSPPLFFAPQAHVVYNEPPDERPVVSVWSPQPGPQYHLIHCPVTDVVYGGARGGGKTYSLIGDAAIRAGKYGSDFRGLFIRRQQTELADVKMKMTEVYSKIGAKWSESKQTWEFPGGGTLVLKYLMNDDDAMMYQGWNLCVEQETPVLMADGTWKPIREIAVGEMVETLEGPREVVATTEPYEAPCAEIRVSVPGVGEVARQVQPVWHHVLATDGLTDGRSPRGPRTQRPPRDTWTPDRAGGELRRGVGRGRPGWISWQEDGPSGSSTSWSGLPEWRLPVPSSARAALHEPGLRSTLRQRGTEAVLAAPEFLSGPPTEEWSGESCGQTTTSTPGSLGGCRPSGRSGGGPLRGGPGNGQGTARRSGGAGGRSQQSRRGDAPGTAPERSRPSSGWYWTHPYTGEERRLLADLRSGELVSAYVGPRMVCDISVADANHYITLGGIVNRNTALYVDEIGSFENRRPIDLLWGAMRTTKGVPVVRRMTCNPGGPGHMWVKQLYLSHGRYRVFHYAPNPDHPNLTIDAVFIPAKLEDNKLLMENDPLYEAKLAAACGGDTALYKAWRDGDWDHLAGTYFSFDPKIHTALPPPMPDYMPKWMAIDWGYTHPAAVLWACDFGDRAYVYRERLYTNTDPVSLGQYIAEVNGDERIENIYLSPDAFARRTGENTVAIELKEGFDRANVMRGAAQLPHPEPAFNDRVNGWQAVAAGLQHGRLVFSPLCTELIRVLPSLVRDPKKPNDVHKVDGDDVADCVRYLWATRKRGDVIEPMEVRAAREINAIDPNHRAMQERIFLARENSAEGADFSVRIRGRRRPGAWFE